METKSDNYNYIGLQCMVEFDRQKAASGAKSAIYDCLVFRVAASWWNGKERREVNGRRWKGRIPGTSGEVIFDPMKLIIVLQWTAICQYVNMVHLHQMQVNSQHDISHLISAQLSSYELNWTKQGLLLKTIVQESCTMTTRCADKSKQTATPPPKVKWLSVDSTQPDVMDVVLNEHFLPKIYVPLFAQLVFRIFNLCGHDLPTSQSYGQTDDMRSACMFPQ